MAQRFNTRVWLSPTVSIDYVTEGRNKVEANRSVLNKFESIYAIKTVKL